MDYNGLIEIEFKRHPRTNVLKLLGINARVSEWHTIGRRAGIDFSLLLWRLLHGDKPARVRAGVRVRWMWPAADIPIALREIAGRRLRVRDYVRDFHRPIDYATLALDDPVPGSSRCRFSSQLRSNAKGTVPDSRDYARATLTHPH